MLLVLNSPSLARRGKTRLRRRKESGATLVEMALIVILLLTIMYGIMGFGFMLYGYHFVNHAAKEAARWAATNGATCNNDNSCNGTGYMNNGPASLANISTYVTNHIPPGIVAGNVTPNPNWVQPAGSPTICSAPVGTQPATPNAPGCTVQVQVAYAFQFIFPLLPTKTTTTAPCTQPGFCLSSTAEMVIIH